MPLTYGFDIDGKITSIADNGGTRNFTYDPTLQLTSGGYASAPENYAYDPEGNRTSSHLSASYVHDTANRLREDEDACYDYDANGNLATKTARVGLAACTGGVTAYEWDVINRLVRIDNPDGTYSAYRYDAHGRRIEKDVNGALTKYVYDDDAILLEFDGANALQARYSHGEEIDQPLAMTRGGDSYFYGVDHLGSVRLLTDAAGAVANRYDYDAFGNLEASSYETVANPYAFTARERDAESGLMFYRARYYDPKIGRFISEDPIGFSSGDFNNFRYAVNNPVMARDPFGYSVLAGQGLMESKTPMKQRIAQATGLGVRCLAELAASKVAGVVANALGKSGGLEKTVSFKCRKVLFRVLNTPKNICKTISPIMRVPKRLQRGLNDTILYMGRRGNSWVYAGITYARRTAIRLTEHNRKGKAFGGPLDQIGGEMTGMMAFAIEQALIFCYQNRGLENISNVPVGPDALRWGIGMLRKEGIL